MQFVILTIILLSFTGYVWLNDHLFNRPLRASSARTPGVVRYAKSVFVIFLTLFIVRTFIVEPFLIPSGSMMPTLLTGDYIFVSKYAYGLRSPISNDVFFAIKRPSRGDVVVFKYPLHPDYDYIKRIIGLPGDKIRYQNKRLTINGKPLVTKDLGSEGSLAAVTRFSEQLGLVVHPILVREFVNKYAPHTIGARFANNEEVEVPAGQYLAMGDNRDSSSDSRVWGFVPEHNLVGKAVYIWMSSEQQHRAGLLVQ